MFVNIFCFQKGISELFRILKTDIEGSFVLLWKTFSPKSVLYTDPEFYAASFIFIFVLLQR